MNLLQATLRRSVCFALLLALCATSVLAQRPGTATVRGQVTDEFGGAIIGASVTVTDAAGTVKTATTDSEGNYALAGLVPGKYVVRAVAQGFSLFESEELEVVAGRSDPLNIKLGVSLEKEEVMVASESPISLDDQNRASAIVLRGKDIDALPDDPDELAAALSALAGPAAGPNGGQITIDGFEGGRIPPRDSIREIRINDNPLAAERDQPGFGGIQILTKPGTDKLRVSASTTFSDESFNSRNPFATERAPYRLLQFGGNVSGTIVPKKSSFFIDFERNAVDDNDIVNATILDPTTLQPTRFLQSIVTPNHRLNLGSRIDYQLNKSNTLIARYNFFRQSFDKLGLTSGFALPGRAFDQSVSQHTLQLTETAVLNATTINETRFQFIHGRTEQNGDNSVPSINVAEAFNGGGSQIGDSFNAANRWDLTNITTIAKGNHSIKFGGRLRGVNLTDFSQNNFGGTFTFAGGVAPLLDANNQIILDASGQPVLGQITSIERFRRARVFDGTGLSAAQLRNLGALPTQFTISGGNPEADVSQVDFGGFVQDDWKLRPNLTIGAGLRYETQSNINSHLNLAPRAYLSWAPDGGGGRQAKTVIRVGFGLFYDRFGENFTLQSNRFDGENQLQFLVTDPAILSQVGFTADGVLNAPTVSQLSSFARPQTTRIVAPDLQAPYSYTGGVFVERQLPKKFTLNTGYITYRTRHALRTRDLDALTTNTFNPGVPRTHLYQYESSGVQNMDQFQLGVNNRFSQAFSIFAFYTYARMRGDTDGPNSFPADYSDLRQEYGRSSFDVHHRFTLGGSIGMPWAKLLLNPIVIANSGRPFNIITGLDTNGDGQFTERPSLASNTTCATRTDQAPNIVCTPLGTFNLRPAAGEDIIARNFGEGPGFFTVNLRISRQWSFGSSPASKA
ncbi:MAG: carboxypeptidase regulatory-like domain-containing protein, partial [Pyrinomonadaceae bacterium]